MAKVSEQLASPDERWPHDAHISHRDNCRCARCINQDTMQRNFKVTDLPTVQALSINASEAGLGVVCEPSHPSSLGNLASVLTV